MKENEILITGGTALKKIIPDAIFVGSKHFDLRDEKEVTILILIKH